MATDLQSTLQALKQRFKAGVVSKPVTYYLSLGDAADQKWTVVVTPNECEVRPGKPENADCVLKTSAEQFDKLVAGTWTPGVMDFMNGRIKTSDIDLLKSLQQAFGL